jgi:hypothetical protein
MLKVMEANKMRDELEVVLVKEEGYDFGNGQVILTKKIPGELLKSDKTSGDLVLYMLDPSPDKLNPVGYNKEDSENANKIAKQLDRFESYERVVRFLGEDGGEMCPLNGSVPMSKLAEKIKQTEYFRKDPKTNEAINGKSMAVYLKFMREGC